MYVYSIYLVYMCLVCVYCIYLLYVYRYIWLAMVFDKYSHSKDLGNTSVW